ncbi:MAG: methyltransferase [Thermoplasmatales archaeon]|nr:methyltransferase [Thermoplasmatales archaeon]
MKQKGLEILLQKVPQPTHPTPTLEQYMTPASIAADIIFNAYQFGDINDKIIVDLGCGTGIFSIGAAILGAKKITGFDVDKESIQLAKKHAEQNNLEIEFNVKDVKDVETKCDTVLMNPPFGAQKSNQKADRKFIEKGFEISHVIYSLHLTKTIPFLEKMIFSLSGTITYKKKYVFPIRWMFEFHEKQIAYYDVTMLRIETKI